jgi:hypothetical protein
MSFNSVTIEQIPKIEISVSMLRDAFVACTPFDCPSRSRFAACYPYSWNDANEKITMERAASVMCHCLQTTENLSRFIFFFTGERIASYDVVSEYLIQAFIKA